MARIPNYSSEEPMLYIISLTEFVLVGSVMFVGMMANVQFYAILVSTVFVLLYRKYSEGQMPNHAAHAAFKAGLYPIKSRLLPSGFAKEFYK